ncbi:MAG: hypothetical protein NVSMB56_08460 [Pyrinomonadaceae bacterium]
MVKPGSEVKAKPTKAVPPSRSRVAVKPVPRQPSRDEAAALTAFERAHKEFARGRFSEARLLFQNLIQKHVGVSEVTARARTYLAVAQSRLETNKPSLRLGSSEAALQSLERAFEIQPFLRSRAQHDPDLAVLRSAPDFERIINALR